MLLSEESNRALSCPSPRDSLPEESRGPDLAQPLAVAFRFLSYRPRTVQETRQRLEKAFPPALVEETLTYLTDGRFLDDAAFAAQWRSSRERRRQKVRRAIAAELKRLGVEQQLIDHTLEDLDELPLARLAALKLASRLADKGCTRDYFQRKVSAFLLRRGFGYGTVKETVNLLWEDAS